MRLSRDKVSEGGGRRQALGVYWIRTQEEFDEWADILASPDSHTVQVALSLQPGVTFRFECDTTGPPLFRIRHGVILNIDTGYSTAKEQATIQGCPHRRFFEVDRGGTLNLKSLVLQKHEAEVFNSTVGDGGCIKVTGGTVTAFETSFKYCSGETVQDEEWTGTGTEAAAAGGTWIADGGAIHASESSFLQLRVCQFHACGGRRGGAIHADSSEVQMGATVFSQTMGTKSGGALSLVGSSLFAHRLDAGMAQMTNPDFKGGVSFDRCASASGAGIHAAGGSKVILENATTGVMASQSGGGVFVVEGNSNITMLNGFFLAGLTPAKAGFAIVRQASYLGMAGEWSISSCKALKKAGAFLVQGRGSQVVLGGDGLVAENVAGAQNEMRRHGKSDWVEMLDGLHSDILGRWTARHGFARHSVGLRDHDEERSEVVGGAFVLEEEGHLVIKDNVLITRNYANDAGGGISASGASKIEIRGLAEVSDNVALVHPDYDLDASSLALLEVDATATLQGFDNPNSISFADPLVISIAVVGSLLLCGALLVSLFVWNRRRRPRSRGKVASDPSSSDAVESGGGVSQGSAGCRSHGNNYSVRVTPNQSSREQLDPWQSIEVTRDGESDTVRLETREHVALQFPNQNAHFVEYSRAASGNPGNTRPFIGGSDSSNERPSPDGSHVILGSGGGDSSGASSAMFADQRGALVEDNSIFVTRASSAGGTNELLGGDHHTLQQGGPWGAGGGGTRRSFARQTSFGSVRSQGSVSSVSGAGASSGLVLPGTGFPSQEGANLVVMSTSRFINTSHPALSPRLVPAPGSAQGSNRSLGGSVQHGPLTSMSNLSQGASLQGTYSSQVYARGGPPVPAPSHVARERVESSSSQGFTNPNTPSNDNSGSLRSSQGHESSHSGFSLSSRASGSRAWGSSLHSLGAVAEGNTPVGYNMQMQSMLPEELRNHFVVVEAVGSGAFGQVYKVVRVRHGVVMENEVEALKVVAGRMGLLTQKELRRLFREAAVMKRIKCKHAVQLYDYGLSSDESRFWFRMEFLEGPTLQQVLKDEGPFEETECVRVGLHTLQALSILHQRCLTHRDVKPANIMRCADPSDPHRWCYKLLDFGVAVGLVPEEAGEEMMTHATLEFQAAGTLAFMSPESLNGGEAINFQSDLWSLGVTLYRLFTGKLPYKGKTVVQMYQDITSTKVPDIRDHVDVARRASVGERFALAVQRSMLVDLGERFRSAAEMDTALYACLVAKQERFFSVFVSYRVRTESVHARILHDELHNTVTPGGHRVKVYLDAVRLIDGENWEKGFSQGLTSSLLFVPLVSLGAVEPMCGCNVGESDDPKPAGRSRLVGGSEDAGDNVLKEWQIALALLEASEENASSCSSPLLRGAYPLLIGSQSPLGSSNYPMMNNLFSERSAAMPPEAVSQATTTAVCQFLEDENIQVTEKTRNRTVAQCVEHVLGLQGGRVWDTSASGFGRTASAGSAAGKGESALDSELDDPHVQNSNGALDHKMVHSLRQSLCGQIPKIHAVLDRILYEKSNQISSTTLS
eukprot:CAMPEP_0172052900 /NCGR_PEP_ID=MMETSP1043-20130122/3913_1 /TAXON_ID=464988 /ORGANISM="Hemiselmis andersenii, Strain CCMP441" /LENGTH=1536 /DNA_ID=CAMNT_0012712101 /DNA_START=311 /DNA_END=4921 /DNA_ORIENTATION=+